jgi:hypothetical protein
MLHALPVLVEFVSDLELLTLEFPLWARCEGMTRVTRGGLCVMYLFLSIPNRKGVVMAALSFGNFS